MKLHAPVPINGPRPVSGVLSSAARCAPMPDPASRTDERVGRLRLQPPGRAGRASASGGITCQRHLVRRRARHRRDEFLRTYLYDGERRTAHERRAFPPQPGEWIDRSEVAALHVRGPPLRGLCRRHASPAPCWAAGVRLLGRSFKYHRPRGVCSLANHDVNAMIQWGATAQPARRRDAARDGMALTAVNTFGGLAGDRARCSTGSARSCRSASITRPSTARSRCSRFYERRMRAHGRARAGRLRHAACGTTPKRYALLRRAGDRRRAGGTVGRRSRPPKPARKVVVVDENAGAGRQPRIPAWRQDRRHGSCSTDLLGRAASLAESRRPPAAPSPPATTPTSGCRWSSASGMTKMRARTLIVATGALRAARRLRQQRPARRDARLGGAAADPPLSRSSRCERARGADGQSRRLPRGARPARRRRRSRGRGRPARRTASAADAAGQPSRAASQCWRGHACHRGDSGSGAICRRPRSCARWTRDGAADRELARLIAVRRHRHERRLGAGRGAVLPGRRAHALRRSAAAVRPGALARRASSPPAGSTASIGWRRSSPTAAAPALRAAAFLGADLRRDGAPPSCAMRTPPSHPYPIFAHPKAKNFVDLDEDVQLQGLRQRGAGRLRQRRAAEALLDRRHGPEPGQAGQHERDPHPGPDQRQTVPARWAAPRRGRSSIPVPLAHLAGRGFIRSARTPLHARHEAPRRGVHAGRRLAAARVLRRRPGKPAKRRSATRRWRSAARSA